MSNYVIITDSSCDLAPETLRQWSVECINLTFHLDGSSQEYNNSDMPSKVFYQRMREGSVFKTAAANMEDFRLAFEPKLQEGTDILYLGFSSGLSNTVNSGRMVAAELLEKYPERRITVIDTLCASAGEGMVVYLAVQKKQSGASLEEVAAYVNGLLPHLCHWFTVDDLVYLKRGGRVSAATALLGGMLNIKPILHVDDEGHLISMSKVRGRRQSIQTLAQKYVETALNPEDGFYFICHGDCLDDAKALENCLFEKFGAKATMIVDVGPVIGSHSGPGTLALFFLGKTR